MSQNEIDVECQFCKKNVPIYKTLEDVDGFPCEVICFNCLFNSMWQGILERPTKERFEELYYELKAATKTLEKHIIKNETAF